MTKNYMDSNINVAFFEISKFLKSLNIMGIVIGAESIILHTKTRLITSDIDYLLNPDEHSKLLNAIENKLELKISDKASISQIETDPFGWISFNLYIKDSKFSISFEFVNINNIEKKFRENLSQIIKEKKKIMYFEKEKIYYLPVEVVFAMRMAVPDWKAYVYKSNANIAELKNSGIEINWEEFNAMIKKLGLEERGAHLKID